MEWVNGEEKTKTEHMKPWEYKTGTKIKQLLNEDTGDKSSAFHTPGRLCTLLHYHFCRRHPNKHLFHSEGWILDFLGLTRGLMLFFHWKQTTTIQRCQAIHFCYWKAANQFLTTALATCPPAVGSAWWELGQRAIVTAPWHDADRIWH